MPIYQLLGGQVRDRAQVYYRVFGETRDQLVTGRAMDLKPDKLQKCPMQPREMVTPPCGRVGGGFASKVGFSTDLLYV
jgi:L-alanine-DL-glutamate epimerase-like enolase superfamily enzyme